MYTVIPPEGPNKFYDVDVLHKCGHPHRHRTITKDPGMAHSYGRRRSPDSCPGCLGKQTAEVLGRLDQKFALPLVASWSDMVRQALGQKLEDGFRMNECLLLTSPDTLAAMVAATSPDAMVADHRYPLMYLLGAPALPDPRIGTGEVYVVADRIGGDSEHGLQLRAERHIQLGLDVDEMVYIGAVEQDFWTGTHSSGTKKFTITPKRFAVTLPKEKTMKRLVISDINTSLNGAWKEIDVVGEPKLYFGSGYEYRPRQVRLVDRGTVLELEVWARPTMTQEQVESRVASCFNMVYRQTTKVLLDPDRSELILAYGFNDKQEILDIHLKTGGVYRYFDVRLEDVLRWLASRSLGTHYNTHIKGKFDSGRL